MTRRDTTDQSALGIVSFADSDGDGCSRHDGQQRHRQNGVCQLLVYYTHLFVVMN